MIIVIIPRQIKVSLHYLMMDTGVNIRNIHSNPCGGWRGQHSFFEDRNEDGRRRVSVEKWARGEEEGNKCRKRDSQTGHYKSYPLLAPATYPSNQTDPPPLLHPHLFLLLTAWSLLLPILHWAMAHKLMAEFGLCLQFADWCKEGLYWAKLHTVLSHSNAHTTCDWNYYSTFNHCILYGFIHSLICNIIHKRAQNYGQV